MSTERANPAATVEDQPVLTRFKSSYAFPVPALLDAVDALTEARDAARAEVARHRALLTRCLPFLAGYECDGQTEGDALTALEGEIEAALVPASEGDGDGN